jgi:hypothetical protein
MPLGTLTEFKNVACGGTVFLGGPTGVEVGLSFGVGLQRLRLAVCNSGNREVDCCGHRFGLVFLDNIKRGGQAERFCWPRERNKPLKGEIPRAPPA